MDKKHQIIVEAQAFGEGQEQHTLSPIVEGIEKRLSNAGIHDSIFETRAILTADTGFSSDSNNQYLRSGGINAYIPDNAFRSRDTSFAGQKLKHGKRHQDTVKGQRKVIPSSEFHFDKHSKTCRCPEGNEL